MDFPSLNVAPYSWILPAAITGAASWIAAQRMARSNEKIAAVKRADDDRKERIAAAGYHAEDLTARFKLLMDGYELRIRELTTEVATLRIEVTQLRAELTYRGTKMLDHLNHLDHDGTD